MNWREIEATWRPAPFWSWNDRLNKEELARQIKEMAAKGWGSFFMHARVGLVTGYLSPEWMELIGACVQEAKERGLGAWLYDEDKWPSGFAGGAVPEANPAYRSRTLVLLKKEEITQADSILAEAEGRFVCKRISPLGNRWFNGASFVDLMNPEAVRYFLKTTHEKYASAVGDYFGKEIPGIFTDEPCYLMEEQYDVPVLPWSEYLPRFFFELKGYRIEEHVVELFLDRGDYQKIRYDFYDAATRLFRDSFTRQYYDWCKRHHLLLTGHMMSEDTLTSQTQWIGAVMPQYEFMHWPGIDKLGRNINQLVTVKQLTSVTDQLNKERALCEVYGQQISFFHRKWIGDWQAALGINFINEHLSLYSMRGERKRDYPPNIFYQQPWWEEEAQFAEYLGRVSKAVAQGKRVLDILVIHPLASVWSIYSPLHKQVKLGPEQQFELPFADLSEKLLEANLDFHYGDEILLEEHAAVEGERFKVGGCSYETVIVPPVITLRRNTVELLREFACSGGRILFLRPLPERIDGSPAQLEVQGECFFTIEDVISRLDAIYPERIKITDRLTGENAKEIICHRRRTDEGELFFLTNTSAEREISALVALPVAMDDVAIVDLNTGEEYQAPAKEGKFAVTFYPAGSILICAGEQNSALPEAPLYLSSGVAFPCQLTKVQDFDKWTVKMTDPNILPLDTVSLDLAGKRVLSQMPIAKAWHQHFYPAAAGTPFRAEYPFKVEKTVHDVCAVIEMAENLKLILLDEREVRSLKRRGEQGAFDPRTSWKDPNFTRVPLGMIEPGSHTLTIVGEKVNNITGPGWHTRVSDFQNHCPTEVETVYLVGDFSVSSFDSRSFALNGNNDSPASLDLTSSGYPFYAGKAEFSICFQGLPGERMVLELGDVAAADVSVYINDRHVSTLYWAPYAIEITDFIQPGKNQLKVIATSTMFNLMGPNYITGINDVELVGPLNFIDFPHYTERRRLLRFGLGRARLWHVGTDTVRS